jgi:hypothetical protein
MNKEAPLPEETFLGNLEDWEHAVFDHADHFRVHRIYGLGQHDHIELKSFVAALLAAGQELRQGRRVLIYAVTSYGRYFAIPRPQWGKYLNIWITNRVC